MCVCELHSQRRPPKQVNKSLLRTQLHTAVFCPSSRLYSIPIPIPIAFMRVHVCQYLVSQLIISSAHFVSSLAECQRFAVVSPRVIRESSFNFAFQIKLAGCLMNFG